MRKGLIIAAIIGIPAIAIATAFLGAATKVATAPADLVAKTADTNNIINSYETFFQLNANYTAVLPKIKEWQGYYDDEKNAEEKARLRTELGALKASCRDLVTTYNANTAKLNKAMFRDKNLPETLNIKTCE
jgi:hypothetical protein